jgi:regulator of replication initiation timing
MRGSAAAAAVVLGLLGASSPWDVVAQTTRSGGDTARAMQQMQQLASERTALQAENAKLKQQLDEAQEKLSAVSARQDSLARRAQTAEAASNRLAAASAASTEGAARTRQQLDEVVAKFRETAQTLKEVETDRNALRQQAQESERQLATCRDHNAQLLRINEEVLVRLENTGFWTRLAADEPFTKLKRTELENIAMDYRQSARDLAEPAGTVDEPLKP